MPYAPLSCLMAINSLSQTFWTATKKKQQKCALYFGLPLQHVWFLLLNNRFLVVDDGTHFYCEPVFCPVKLFFWGVGVSEKHKIKLDILWGNYAKYASLI